MNNVIRNLYCLLAFLVPIYFNFLPEDGFEFNKITLVYVLTGIIAVVWGIKIWRERKIAFPKDKLILLVLIFLLFNLISLIFSIHPYSSLVGNSYRFNGGVLSLLNYIVLFLIFIETFHDDKKIIHDILGAILLSSLLVSLYGIYQLINLATLDTRIISTFGQPNYLGAYLAFVLPLNLYFFLKETYLIKKVGLTFLFLINLFVLFSTGSRSAWLAATIAIIIFLIISGKAILKKKKILFTAIILFVLSVLLVLPFHKQISYRVNTQLFTETNQQELTGGFSLRLFAWKSAWQVFIHNPMLGTGPETMMFSTPKYMDAKINNHIEWGYKFDKAHNEFLDILANTGIFSFLAYLAILFFAIKQCWFHAPAWNHDVQKNSELRVLGISLASIVVVNLFGFSIVTTALYSWLTLALITTGSDFSKRSFRIPPKLFVPLFVLLILSVLFVLLFWTRIYLANIAFTRGDLESAVWLNPNIDRYHGTLAIQYLNIGQTNMAKSEAEKAVQLNIFNADNYRVLALVFSDLDQERTLSSYNKALELEPTNPKIYMEKAQYLIQIGQKGQAKECLGKALELKPNYPEAQNLLLSIE